MQPMALVVKMPEKITPTILAGCASAVPGGVPVFVDRVPTPGTLVNKCTFNVRKVLAESPGAMVLGWEIGALGNLFLDCIGHAVIRYDDQLRCVTPSKYGDTKVLFLPDPRLTFDFDDPMARMPTMLVPISSRWEVKRLIEVCSDERSIKTKYPVSAGQIIIQGEDAIALMHLAREKQILLLRAILATTGHSSKCPCGSGKKFRKCHQGGAEQMLRSFNAP